jgi:hypothetical protein
VSRRKAFDPETVSASFWGRDDVQVRLANRDIGGLIGLYLTTFDSCTQTQLARMTEHDRSDISNWVRGVRLGVVSDIGVLSRIADGLGMPDRARMLLGIAPVDLIIGPVDAVPASTTGLRANPAGSVPGLRLALCGSRVPDGVPGEVDRAIRTLARLILTRGYSVTHGPVGVGIEVMTYIADHYRPPRFDGVMGVFGRRNIVKDADFVIVVAGAQGTQDEIDMALALGKRVVALAPTGGTARRFHERARSDTSLRAWLTDDQFTAFDGCRDVEDGVRFIEHLLITIDSGAST